MKLSIALLILISISFLSCDKSKVQSGEITYEITYPYNELSNLMEIMLPKTMTIVFKGDKMKTTIEKGNFFTTDIISNETTRELEMRFKMGTDIFNSHLNKEDITNFINSQPKYNISNPINGDSLVNCFCQHYEVDCTNDSIDIFPSVFTSDFTIKNGSWFSAYHEIEGMPLESLIDRYDLFMKVKAINFIERDVEDSEFEPKFDYIEVPYKTYDRKVQDLFDVMLD
jgi:hypothetical protein